MVAMNSPEVSGATNIELVAGYVFVALATITIHFTLYKNVNYFRTDVLFLFGYLIVNFQWPIMLAISRVDEASYSQLSRISTHVNFGTWLSLLGLLSWMTGFWSFKYSFTPKKIHLQKKYKLGFRDLRNFSLLLFILFLLTAGTEFYSGAIYKIGGSADAISGLAAYIYTVFHVSIITLTGVVVYSTKDQYKDNFFRWILGFDKIYLSIVGLYCAIFFFVGDRGGPVQVLMAFFLLYGSIIKPVSFWKFLVLAVIGISAMYEIGNLRGGEMNAQANSDGNFLYDVTVSLASSARTLYIAIDYVHNVDDLFFGKLWLGNIFGIFPFLQKLYISLTGEPAYLLNSASFVTYLRHGLNAPTGEGTSLIGDIYLNFGEPGIVFFMFWLGYLIKRVQDIVEAARGVEGAVIGAGVGCVVFYMSRATLLTPLQTTAWGLVMVYFLVTKKRVV